MRKPTFACVKTMARIFGRTTPFCNIASTIHLRPKLEIASLWAILCGGTARFVSALVGNHKIRVSYDAAHLISDRLDITIKPRSEKTGLRGFRQGPIQTRLYNHTRWLEA